MINMLFNISDYLAENKWKSIFLLTFLSYTISYFFFENRENISEYLIVNTIYQNCLNGFQGWLGIYFYDGQKYISQMGFHGGIFSIPMLLGLSASSLYIRVLILVLTFAFNYTIFSIAIELKKRFGRISSLFFMLVVFFNPIFLINSGNLYWMYFLYFIPFYYTLKYYGRIKLVKFYFILGILFLIKFSVNFEYSSTVVLSCMIPIVLKYDYHFIKGLKTLFKDGLFLFSSSVISFSIIIFVLVVQLSFGEDNGFSNVKKVIQSYAMGSKNEPHFLSYETQLVEWNSMYKSIYKPKVDVQQPNNGWDGVLKARDSYNGYIDLLKYVNFDNKKALFYSMQLFVFMILAILLIVYFSLRSHINYSAILSIIFAIIASSSWALLMPLHFYLHSIYWRGISDVILIFPFYATVAFLIGYVIEMEILKYSFDKTKIQHDSAF